GVLDWWMGGLLDCWIAGGDAGCLLLHGEVSRAILSPLRRRAFGGQAGPLLVRAGLAIRRRLRTGGVGEFGKFVRNSEPEFQGAIERREAIQTDARDSPEDGGLQVGLICRGGSLFEGKVR